MLIYEGTRSIGQMLKSRVIQCKHSLIKIVFIWWPLWDIVELQETMCWCCGWPTVHYHHCWPCSCKKAYSIFWQYIDNLNDIIIRLGCFPYSLLIHIVGKLLQSSGFIDIVIEAGVSGSGSVEKLEWQAL